MTTHSHADSHPYSYPASAHDAPVSHGFSEWLATQPGGFRPEVIAQAAHPTNDQTDAHAVPQAAIVGLGVNTREAHEIFNAVVETTWLLIDYGFTTIALQDNQRVAELLDDYVTGGEVDVDDALTQAWGPWQIIEMRDALTQLRAYNQSTDGPDIRIIGLHDARALPADYDRIIELLTDRDQHVATQVEELLTIIRGAHDAGEHVLHVQGAHPGTPFVDLARRARDVAAELEPSPQRDAAVKLLDTVVAYHAEAIGVGHDAVNEERQAAEKILGYYWGTGERIVIWDGSAHIAAHSSAMLGSHLREELGDQYLAVHYTCGQGDIGRISIPAPRTDSIEAACAAAGRHMTIQLRGTLPTGVEVQMHRPWPTRLISGMYTPDQDAAHYLELPSPVESFDAVVFIPEVTPAEALHNG